jgi:hypothetical protein
MNGTNGVLGIPLVYRMSYPTDDRFVTADASFRVIGNPLGALTLRAVGCGPGGGDSEDDLTINTDGAGGWWFQGTYDTEGTAPLPEAIDNSELDIAWSVVKRSGAVEEYGSSVNHIYVTGADAGWNFETVLDVACEGADGLTPPLPGDDPALATQRTEAVVDGVWSRFSDREVRRVDGVQMQYWGPATDITHLFGEPWFFTTAGLLGHADGRCGAWASFFIDTLTVHGVSSVKGSIGTSVDPPAEGPPVGTTRSFRSFDVGAKPAQGNAAPWHVFPDHAIVRVTGITAIYDPSYGGEPSVGATIAEAEQKWEDASVTGVRWLYLVGDSLTGHFEAGTAFTAHTAGTRQTAFVY